MSRTCRSCEAEIDWAVSVTTGARMPVDHGSAGLAGGNLAVWRTDDGVLWCRGLKKDEDPGPGEKRGTPHWSSCPKAMNYKRDNGND